MNNEYENDGLFSKKAFRDKYKKPVPENTFEEFLSNPPKNCSVDVIPIEYLIELYKNETNLEKKAKYKATLIQAYAAYTMPMGTGTEPEDTDWVTLE